jgi:hypothetical protein
MQRIYGAPYHFLTAQLECMIKYAIHKHVHECQAKTASAMDCTIVRDYHRLSPAAIGMLYLCISAKKGLHCCCLVGDNYRVIVENRA